VAKAVALPLLPAPSIDSFQLLQSLTSRRERGLELPAKNHKVEGDVGIAPCTILSCTHRSHPLPWVLGGVPLEVLWLIQAGWKVLSGPHGICDVSFPPSWCLLAGRYAREGLAPFGSS